ncbi:MAG: hypothetical protein ACOC5T_06965, partial [Elusimicrobiota bacterium]
EFNKLQMPLAETLCKSAKEQNTLVPPEIIQWMNDNDDKNVKEKKNVAEVQKKITRGRKKKDS